MATFSVGGRVTVVALCIRSTSLMSSLFCRTIQIYLYQDNFDVAMFPETESDLCFLHLCMRTCTLIHLNWRFIRFRYSKAHGTLTSVAHDYRVSSDLR